MNYYYLHEDNTAQGPHTGDELISMLSEDEITLNTLIAEEGGEEWIGMKARLSSLSKSNQQPAIPQLAPSVAAIQSPSLTDPHSDTTSNEDSVLREYKSFVLVATILAPVIGGAIIYYALKKSHIKLAKFGNMMSFVAFGGWILFSILFGLFGGNPFFLQPLMWIAGTIFSVLIVTLVKSGQPCPSWWNKAQYWVMASSACILLLSFLFGGVKDERGEAYRSSTQPQQNETNRSSQTHQQYIEELNRKMKNQPQKESRYDAYQRGLREIRQRESQESFREAQIIKEESLRERTRQRMRSNR